MTTFNVGIIQFATIDYRELAIYTTAILSISFLFIAFYLNQFKEETPNHASISEVEIVAEAVPVISPVVSPVKVTLEPETQIVEEEEEIVQIIKTRKSFVFC